MIQYLKMSELDEIIDGAGFQIAQNENQNISLQLTAKSFLSQRRNYTSLFETSCIVILQICFILDRLTHQDCQYLGLLHI